MSYGKLNQSKQIYSLLWIGRGDGEACAHAAKDPLLDVAWVRDADDALSLPLHDFDALVLDAGGVEDALPALHRLELPARDPAPRPPLLVRVRDAQTCGGLLLDRGASEVVARDTGADSTGLRQQIRRMIERPRARRSVRRTSRHARVPVQPAFKGLVSCSAAFEPVLALVERAANARARVLITGETGTGKELLAQAVHYASPRRDQPLVAVNCGALAQTLLESELFGHVKGAFTGAERNKTGLFEQAEGGTLFLDEVGETSPALQARLLRVLQDGEVRPVGGTRTRPVDVRVIAATNRDLWHEVEAGRFRRDLYYRLAVLPIAVPPLRKRPEDILPLARHFLAKYAAQDGRHGCTLSRDAESFLLAHAWPGNVRELENEMHRAVTLAEPGGVIGAGGLSPALRKAVAPALEAERPGGLLRDMMARFESFVIYRRLDAHGGSRTATARHLGLTREGLYKKMKRHGLN